MAFQQAERTAQRVALVTPRLVLVARFFRWLLGPSDDADTAPTSMSLATFDPRPRRIKREPLTADVWI
jgi:hypothetical protein